MLQRIITFFERYSFGVCTYIGERLNISIAKIRLFFIYSSFLAVGFPLVFYFFAGIVLDIRNYVKRKRTRAIDL
ncbi:PspC family transcriptional regulator [Mucilaginibacter achroorhodeus]|uniref:PspC family transcriptional regulator n=1 Tax=Mucilaginibacter achroorhodeus TaxID=2599294 RepID=A0A563U7J9_9SPHI|nr:MULTISPECIES: PspC family transcriptional regulator [Mucilaginibacter]QXV65149.1 PspC family transcriptional regulator [Mucilaginibacter sp. 21P]TWR27293.1 PspC family transcriptional regulator [Mucilaginibacter achroorhodeus]